MAEAVPRRAIATWMPIADASSCPVNHFVTTFETVMPVMSHPTPNMPKPSADTSTCVFRCSGIRPKSVTGISTYVVGTT